MMPLEPRDNSRYGVYKVNIEGIGDCNFSIDIAGFGEEFCLEKDDDVLFVHDTSNTDYDNDIETDDGFSFDVGYPYYVTVSFKWSDMVKVVSF